MKVKVINSGDAFEGKTGIVEADDGNRSLVLVDFDDKGHKVRQYFTNEQLEPINESEPLEEQDGDVVVGDEGKFEITNLNLIDPIIPPLAKELGVEEEAIIPAEEYEGDQSNIHYSGYSSNRLYVVNDTDLYVVLTEKEAEDRARDFLQSHLEDSGVNVIGVDRIDSYLDEDFFEEIHRESEESYVNEGLSDEEVLEYAVNHNIDIMDNDGEPLDVYDIREQLIEIYMNDYKYHSQWYRDNYGEQEFIDFINDNFDRAFDSDRWIDDVIRYDGVGQVLDTYDGSTYLFTVDEDTEEFPKGTWLNAFFIDRM